MGHDHSKPLLLPPLSFKDCFVDGEVDISRYLHYGRKIDDIDDANTKHLERFVSKKRKIRGFTQAASTSSTTSTNIRRSVKKQRLFVRDNDGSLRELLPTDTLWYLLYVKSPLQDERLLKSFRNRFRLPYSFFLDLSDAINMNERFNRWVCSDCTGEQPSNIKLLLLGSLRYLGRSWTFDDIHEANGISREVNRTFFKTFIEYGSTCLYKKHVIDVANSISVSEHERLFRLAGFNGCIGSSDGSHVSMLNCLNWASVSHKGPKLSCPARTYNLTVTHSRQIIGSTSGHPSTWNDKTIVLFDPLISKVNDGIIPDDFNFSLFEKNKDGTITEVTYSGVWFMVDNGYLSWSCTIPPVKNACSYECLRFSEWLESMRKDVECTFGILKGRFSVLKTGIRLHSLKDCDKIWLTCCALHNRLLFIDGLNEGWENGAHSDFVSSDDTNFAVSRLNREFGREEVNQTRDFDLSSIDWSKYTVNGKRVVKK